MRYVLLEKAVKDPKKVLVWDLSYGAENAARIAEDGHEVLYYTEWPDSYPKFEKYAIGLGMDGIKKVKKFFRYIDDVDYIVFQDSGRGDLCNNLRSKGYKVFGAGRGERLEFDRAWAKKVQKQIGISTPTYRVIKGVDNLLRFLRKNPGKWVKLNVFRGNKESFFAEDEDAARIELNALRPKLGPFEETFEFIVEDPIKDVVESGWDLFFNGHEFLKPYLWGYCMTRFYAGKYVDKMPPALEDIANRIKPVLVGLEYRGVISVEAQIDKTGKAWVTDWTPRFAMPLSYVYTLSMRNYSDVIFAVAEGKDVKIDTANKYVGYVEIRSTNLIDSWIKVGFPKKYRQNIKLRAPAKFEGDYYTIPCLDLVIGAVVDTGPNIDKVLDNVINIGEHIVATGSDVDEISDSLDKIKDEITNGRKRGLDF